MKISSYTGLSIFLFFTTALWGIFWLPLRHIESAGISGIWAVLGINLAPLIFLLPFVFHRRARFFEHFNAKTQIGIALGGGMAFYAIAFLYTTVLRTTLLFYFSPIWATLLSMLILREKINAGRWIAIAVGLTGLVLILSNRDVASGSGFNRGDVFALLAGLFWGYSIVIIRKSPDIPVIDMVPAQYFWATMIAIVVLATTVPSEDFRIPTSAQWLQSMPVIIGFYVLIILPTIYICTRIAQILSPGRVCLLMMSEVLVAAISAPLLAGESISVLEWAAGLLIVAATVIEVFTGSDNSIETGTTS